MGEEHDADAEKYRKHHADGRVLLESAVAHHRQDHQGADQAGEQGTHEERHRALGVGEQETEANAGQGGMGQGVAE